MTEQTEQTGQTAESGQTPKPTGAYLLELHDWRKLKPDDDHDLIVLFHFSLMPEELRRQGQKPTHNDSFWTEARLDRFLADQPGWRDLGETDRVKALLRYTQEQIGEARRKLRHVELFWTPQGKHNEGPAWDLNTVALRRAPPLRIEAEDRQTSPRFMARKGAGHEDA